MWAIYGTEYEDYYHGCRNACCYTTESLVATFDTEKSAKDYLRKSKLKNTKGNRKFKKKSLLSYYEYADISKYTPCEPTHEPEL